MTPKDKAKELYNKFYVNISHPFSVEIRRANTEQCALIAVDEVIANIEPSVSMDVIEARIKYWQEVKQEIEKL